MRNEREFANRMKWPGGALAGMSTLVLAACAHGDQPGPAHSAATIRGSVQIGAAENAGVRMVAWAHTWDGDPPTLSQYVLPIWIQIENHSGRALWLRYNAVRIEDPCDSQVTLTAVPPVKVNGKAEIPVSALPPEFRLYDPWWGTSLEPEFQHYIVRNLHWEENLPTREMIRQAISEGVVPDGRKIGGFVYFQKTNLDLKALTLRTDLVDATTKESFARVEIPLAAVLD